MIGSLTARIFAIFWLTLALVLMLVLMLPKLDSRQMTELLDSEQRQGLMIEQHVEAELANDPPNDLMWWRRLFRAIDKWAPPGQRLLLVTTEGRVIGAERSEMQIIRNFIGQADNADHPQKKKYGRVELVGPFSVRDGEDNYQLYLIRPASSSQSDFINLLFDRPLLLLIVTMLVSTPLLLWLAWSLAKPARKLKNAADEVAQGNLRQHPELEAGPQEFLAAGASFNQMVTALERMMTSQQRLLSDISHELRTPLTRLQLGTALLRRRSGESKELERIETEAQRLDSMINDLLVMSRNQQKNALVSETIKANQLWSEVLDNAAFEAEQMGKSLTVNFPPGPWPLYGNPNALEVMGIYDGYLGLYEDRMVQLDRYSVSDMINRGGTFLGSARFPEFRDENIRAVAIENLKKRGIDALVVIGGDGSYMGAMRLTEMGFPCIGLPGTIDNDIKGTDYTIGFFTALSTVVEAIDRLRDTSSSHQRISVVEVMGRYCGDLTLAAAIAGGCEFVVVPEVEFSREDLVNEIKAGIAKGKKHAIVAITEHMCDVDELAHFIEKETGRETRATVLGHIQRGGSPVPYDRILASRMGAYAIDLLLAGYGGRCVGIQNEQLVHHDIIDAIENMKRPFKGDWLDCAKKLY